MKPKNNRSRFVHGERKHEEYKSTTITFNDSPIFKGYNYSALDLYNELEKYIIPYDSRSFNSVFKAGWWSERRIDAFDGTRYHVQYSLTRPLRECAKEMYQWERGQGSESRRMQGLYLEMVGSTYFNTDWWKGYNVGKWLRDSKLNPVPIVWVGARKRVWEGEEQIKRPERVIIPWENETDGWSSWESHEKIIKWLQISRATYYRRIKAGYYEYHKAHNGIIRFRWYHSEWVGDSRASKRVKTAIDLETWEKLSKIALKYRLTKNQVYILQLFLAKPVDFDIPEWKEKASDLVKEYWRLLEYIKKERRTQKWVWVSRSEEIYNKLGVGVSLLRAIESVPQRQRFLYYKENGVELNPEWEG